MVEPIGHLWSPSIKIFPGLWMRIEICIIGQLVLRDPSLLMRRPIMRAGRWVICQSQGVLCLFEFVNR